jgi:hypothetical protein
MAPEGPIGHMKVHIIFLWAIFTGVSDVVHGPLVKCISHTLNPPVKAGKWKKMRQ